MSNPLPAGWTGTDACRERRFGLFLVQIRCVRRPLRVRFTWSIWACGHVLVAKNSREVASFDKASTKALARLDAIVEEVRVARQAMETT